MSETLQTQNRLETEYSTPIKDCSIWYFFWKLYEITLKVIIDAVLERVWHK